MAETKSTIQLIFEGVDKTSAATQSALANAQKFAGGVESATQPIADFTAGAVKLEAALLTVGAAITAFSIVQAADFQSALADLQKVLSDTDNIDQYRDKALELSVAYGVASVDVLKAITNYKQAGFTAKEAADLTVAGLDLVIAGSVEAARGAELLVSSIKGFGAEAADSAIIVDLLNQVSNEYAATTGQLLEGFSELSPVAAAAGFSLQETIGVLTPGIEVFQSGSEVANALKTSLLRLVDDSKPVQEGLAALGVSQRDANGELRSARDIYFDVAKALGGVDENQRLFIASQLAGINQSAKFLAITDGLDKTLTISADSYKFLGSAAAEVAIQLASANKQIDSAQAALTNLFISIGTPLLDEFGGIADAIREIFLALTDSVQGGALTEIVAFIEDQMGGLAETLATIARNLPEALGKADLSGFTDGVKAVVSAINELFSDIDLTSVDGLAALITTVGSAFEGLSQFTAGVIKSFGPLFDQFVKLADGINEVDGVTFEAIGNLAGFATQANILAGGIENMLPSIKSLVAIIAGAQGVTLLSGLASAAQALSGSTGLIALLGKGGLVAAAGGAGFALGTLANDLTEGTFGTSISTWVTDRIIDLGFLDDKAAEIVANLNNSGPIGANAADAVVEAIRQADAEMANFGRTADGVRDVVFNFETGMYEVVEGVEAVGDELDELGRSGTGEIRSLDEAMAVLTATNETAAGSFSAVADQTGAVADKTRDLAAAVKELSIEEKVALIEAQSDIATARIEANAKVTVAAYDSITESIKSTGEQLTNLFGLLGDDSISKLDKLDIKDQIDKETGFREEALKLQERLTEAQIRSLDAQTAALSGGKPLITVNGDGLAPHLRAIMFEVLEAVQIEVNRDGYALLLNAGL